MLYGQGVKSHQKLTFKQTDQWPIAHTPLLKLMFPVHQKIIVRRTELVIGEQIELIEVGGGFFPKGSHSH